MSGNLFQIKNLKRAFYYMKKNGIRQAYYAAKERAGREIADHYAYKPLSVYTLNRQRAGSAALPYKFSILVPAYHPNPIYFREMLESVIRQTYSKWEVIIADAGEDEAVENIVKEYQAEDDRIHYRKLAENKGISANTNQALQFSTGDYVGLLDHDDLLTPDALFEMAAAIADGAARGVTVQMLYSDEDKCSSDGLKFFEFHEKPELNLDLILSNNYICHFLVMERKLMQTLEFRSAYDGAQDYDLVLRAIHTMLGRPSRHSSEERIISIRQARVATVHIPKVLYHWRCHDESTAANPQSKEYAYEAGKRAIEDFLRKRGWNGIVSHTRHLGFYRIDFIPDIMSVRPEVGLVGGSLYRKNKIAGGIYKADGTPLFHGLHKEYSGYMHRASLCQEAEAVDIRCMTVSPEVEGLLEEVIGLPYLKNPKTGRFNWKDSLREDVDYKKISLQICQKVRAAGYLIVWDPQIKEKLKY